MKKSRMMHKTCANKICSKRFSVKINNYHRKYCYDCDARKIWREANPERWKFLLNRWTELNPKKAKLRYRRNRLKTKYGMTLEDHREECRKQNNRCAICRRRFNGRWNKPNVDHKPGTKGTHRGLLCVDCNLLIGHARESIKVLLAAIQYIKKWETV
jgi:hypothetical protein